MPIKVTRLKKYTVSASSEQNKIISDIPESMGGLNLGMDPHELLEAALASCTAITLQMYADRYNIKLESADVEVKIIDEKGTDVVISRTINLVGDLTDEQKNKLLTIATKCPIHKLLTKNILIQDSN